MKFEVFNKQEAKRVARYVVPNLFMHNLEEWGHLSEITIPLEEFITVVQHLNTIDPVMNQQSTITVPFELYLPPPILDKTREHLMERLGEEESEALFRMSPPVKVSTILTAFAQEIVQTHLPNHKYQVRVSDE